MSKSSSYWILRGAEGGGGGVCVCVCVCVCVFMTMLISCSGLIMQNFEVFTMSYSFERLDKSAQNGITVLGEAHTRSTPFSVTSTGLPSMIPVSSFCSK